MRSEQTVAAMACPVCKTGLSLSERQGVEIDFCPTCRGVWLDRGELDKIIDRNAAETQPARPAAPAQGYREQPFGYNEEHLGRYGKKKKSFL